MRSKCSRLRSKRRTTSSRGTECPPCRTRAAIRRNANLTDLSLSRDTLFEKRGAPDVAGQGAAGLAAQQVRDAEEIGGADVPGVDERRPRSPAPGATGRSLSVAPTSSWRVSLLPE